MDHNYTTLSCMFWQKNNIKIPKIIGRILGITISGAMYCLHKFGAKIAHTLPEKKVTRAQLFKTSDVVS